MLTAMVAGRRRTATSTPEPAECPECHARVDAVLRHQTPHWRHRANPSGPGACTAGQGMSEWHYLWQAECSDLDRIEVAREGHRADLLNLNGHAIEFQRSAISDLDIRNRETHWRRGVWVLDATGEEAISGWRVHEESGSCAFVWDRPHRLALVASWPIWLDCGERGMVQVSGTVTAGGRVVGWPIPKDRFVREVINGGATILVDKPVTLAPRARPRQTPAPPPGGVHLTDVGPCAGCRAPDTRIYGEGGNPLCDGCRAVLSAWRKAGASYPLRYPRLGVR